MTIMMDCFVIVDIRNYLDLFKKIYIFILYFIYIYSTVYLFILFKL